MSHESRGRRPVAGEINVGLGGIFKGLGDMLSLIAEISEREGGAVERSGTTGDGEKLRGVYGISVRTGLNGVPQVERFGNLRRSSAGPEVAPVREPLVDLFDEGETMVVIVELPGVDERELQIELHGDVLSLETSGERRYAREILLPAPAAPESLQRSYRNGILELRLSRQS